MVSEKTIEENAKEIRKLVMQSLNKAGSGHTAGSLGMADIFSTLYFKILKHNPKNPSWKDRDYLFLSNGHICPVLYSTLSKAGYFEQKELFKLRQINSLLQGHPHNNIPGIENSSGPLGQGLSMAVGAAISLNKDGLNNHVFAICGDGELNEGQCFEAFLLIQKYCPSNLTVIIDYNQIQLDGNTKDIMNLDIKLFLESLKLNVITIDGHNITEIIKVLETSKKSKTPTIILAKTIPGKGVSFMENDYHWHGKAPNDEETIRALEELK